MFEMTPRWIVACCLLIGCTVGDGGCDPFNPRRGTEGELGRGLFYYSCLLGADDALCDHPYYTRSIPDSVAVAGLFTVIYESYDSGSHLQVIPASRLRTTSHAEAHAILFDGPHAFFAIDPDGTVYDLIHVRSQPVSGVGFESDAEAGIADQLLLLPGEFAEIEVKPLNSAGEVLGGVLDWSWHNDSPQVVSLKPTIKTRFVKVFAIAEGQAVITASVGGMEGHLIVIVDGGDDSDSDSDSDHDTDWDTDRLDEDEGIGRHQ